jgi:hypothetical protein
MRFAASSFLVAAVLTAGSLSAALCVAAARGLWAFGAAAVADLVDAAILVVAANEGIKPQTREHLMALQAKNIQNVIIVQNKIDLVSKEKAIENYNMIKKEFKGTIAESAIIIPVSSQQEINLERIYEALCNLKIPYFDIQNNVSFLEGCTIKRRKSRLPGNFSNPVDTSFHVTPASSERTNPPFGPTPTTYIRRGVNGSATNKLTLVLIQSALVPFPVMSIYESVPLLMEHGQRQHPSHWKMNRILACMSPISSC